MFAGVLQTTASMTTLPCNCGIGPARRFSTRRKLLSRNVRGSVQRRSGQKSLALQRKGRSVSTAKAMAIISLPLSFPKTESLNPQSNSQPTTPVSGTNLAILSTWWNRAVRLRYVVGEKSPLHSRSGSERKRLVTPVTTHVSCLGALPSRWPTGKGGPF